MITVERHFERASNLARVDEGRVIVEVADAHVVVVVAVVVVVGVAEIVAEAATVVVIVLMLLLLLHADERGQVIKN